mgnify:FL=1
MKLITFAVPGYNSEEYLSRCVESLLPAGKDCEIILIDDGSADNTGIIADRYARNYPDIVRTVHKENGGHGSGVNMGMAMASGLYYKVVDSDDWLDGKALKTLLDTIKRHIREGRLPDLYITDFVYEKVNEGSRYERSFRKNFPAKEFFSWKEVKRFHTSSVLLMHALVYRTDKLRESGTVLPEHTFYVDNIFAYKPLPYTKTLSYLNIPLYRYYIGRSDQSVSAENITKRYLQQIRVMRALTDAYPYREIARFPKGLKRYMLHDLAVVMTLTVTFTSAGKNDVQCRKKDLKELWRDIKEKDAKLYKYLKYNTYTSIVNWMPFRLQGKATWLGYKFFRKKLKCS